MGDVVQCLSARWIASLGRTSLRFARGVAGVRRSFHRSRLPRFAGLAVPRGLSRCRLLPPLPRVTPLRAWRAALGPRRALPGPLGALTALPLPGGSHAARRSRQAQGSGFSTASRRWPLRALGPRHPVSVRRGPSCSSRSGWAASASSLACLARSCLSSTWWDVGESIHRLSSASHFPPYSGSCRYF